MGYEEGEERRARANAVPRLASGRVRASARAHRARVRGGGAGGACFPWAGLLRMALLIAYVPPLVTVADDSLHVVQRGETLEAIAAHHGVTWRAVADANRLSDPDSLQPGQKLRIPSAAQARAAASKEQKHKVARGETIWGLARRYGVSVESILATNGLTSKSVLDVGQVLTIPSGAAPAIAAAADPALVRQLKMRAKPRRWRYIVIHHSATREGTVEAMDTYHRETRHMTHGLAYHFVIGNGRGMQDGELEVGSRWTWQLQGGHVRSASLNEEAIGICLVGDFQDRHPSRKQMDQLVKLVRYLQQQYRIPGSRVRLHREMRNQSTICPGRLFPAAEFKRKLLP